MNDKIITLKIYQSQIECLVDLEVLQSNNIEASIHNDQLVEMYPMFSTINEGLKIVVFENDFESAIKILSDFHKTATNKE